MPETNTTPVVLPNRKDGVMAFAPFIMTGDWLKLSATDRVTFATEWAKLIEGVGKVNAKFNQTVWAGHTDGSISEDVKPTRKQREGDTPGRKAKVRTLEEQLFGG